MRMALCLSLSCLALMMAWASFVRSFEVTLRLRGLVRAAEGAERVLSRCAPVVYVCVCVCLCVCVCVCVCVCGCEAGWGWGWVRVVARRGTVAP